MFIRLATAISSVFSFSWFDFVAVDSPIIAVIQKTFFFGVYLSKKKENEPTYVLLNKYSDNILHEGGEKSSTII